MTITSLDICNAADQLIGFVGYHGKRGTHIVRFSEDAFGMDVADESITPCSEFVWRLCKAPAWPCAASAWHCC